MAPAHSAAPSLGFHRAQRRQDCAEPVRLSDLRVTWRRSPDRKEAPTNLRRTGAVAGLVAGALGAAVFAVHHPGGTIPFIALWYGGSILLCTLFGAIIGPRLFLMVIEPVGSRRSLDPALPLITPASYAGSLCHMQLKPRALLQV